MNAFTYRKTLGLLCSVALWACLPVLLSCSAKNEKSSSENACTQDSQCKGNRVCIDGVCAYPDNGAGTAGASGGGLSGSDVIDRYDANGDGVLSPNEAPADIQSSFDQMDTNNDGVLTASEIGQATAAPGAAGSVINTATQGASAAAQAASAVSGEICAEGTATPTRVAPKVVLLLDGSTTMGESYSDRTSRWEAMRQAILDQNTGVVMTMQGLIEFGLVIYSGPMGGGNCPIPGQVVGPALNNYQAISAAFPRTQPGVFTPTGQALQLVCEALPGVAQSFRPQYVVLATDGQPNSCSVPPEQMMNPPTDYQSVIDAANFCCSQGVTIYVISLAAGGAEYQAHLQDVANIGACTGSPGTGTVYSPQDPGQLSASLGQLMGGAVMCDVLLNGSVVKGKECQGSVALNGQTLGCNSSDGWVLASESVIRLQGAACEAFKADPAAVVTAKFPCEVFVPGGGPGGGGAGSGSGGGGTGGSGSGGGGTGGSGSGGGGTGGHIF